MVSIVNKVWSIRDRILIIDVKTEQITFLLPVPVYCIIYFGKLTGYLCVEFKRFALYTSIS
jgi:hypothetical protein